MATIVFIIISFIFVGLGLPDSVFNAAWPSISNELGVAETDAIYVFVCLAVGTTLASLVASQLVGRFGTATVSSITTLLMAGLLIAFAQAQSLLNFCLFSIPLGFGTGIIDCTLTKYATAKYSPSKLNFLYCFYSIGASISPLLMFISLNSSNDWRNGYELISLIMTIIAAITLIALPFVNKYSESAEDAETNTLIISLEKDRIVFSPGELIRIPAVRSACVLCFLTAGIEFSCGLWGSTYLVETIGLSPSEAAGFLSFYYIGITAGRIFSGRVAIVTPAQKIVFIMLAFFGLAFILFFLPTEPFFKGAALFLVGFGNGPILPNVTSLTPLNFGNNLFGSVTTAQTIFANLGMLFLPLSFAMLTAVPTFGFDIFPFFILLLYVSLFITSIVYSNRTKQLRIQLNHEIL